MDFKIFTGIISASLALGSAYLYIKDIYAGNTKPHIYTWLIWTILTVVAFIGQVSGGAGAGSWATGVSAIYCIYVIYLSFQYGSKDITFFDKVCLVLAILSLIPWLLTQNLVVSVILVTIVDIVGFFPTMRKTWKAPYSESLGSMYFDAFKHGLSILSIANYSLLTWFNPAGILVAKIAIIAEIMYRRSSIKLHKKSRSGAK